MVKEHNKRCRIFFCYRKEGLEVAKNFLSVINDKENCDEQGNNTVYGKAWLSDLEPHGNYVCDIPTLIGSAKKIVLFISKNFTQGFFDDNGKINLHCVTAQELVAIERNRQKREDIGDLDIYTINIDGYSIDNDDDRGRIQRLFEYEGILEHDSLDAICSNNMNAYHRGDSPKDYNDLLNNLKIADKEKSTFGFEKSSSSQVKKSSVTTQQNSKTTKTPNYPKIFISIIVAILIMGLLVSVPIGLTQSNGGQMFIAQCYEDTNKFDKAVYWYKKAADSHNNNEAQYILGEHYFNGQGVERSYSEAYKRYKQSAEQGYLDAQFRLGYLFDTGVGVKEIDEEAVKWYTLAAETGDPSSQCNLAIKYYKGEGTEQDYTKAFDLFEKSAKQGVSAAQFYLGLMYSNGYGVDVDYKKAFYWYKLGAEQGDAGCQNNLGVLYSNGHGVEKSVATAIAWYTKAANNGDITAMTNLGSKYYYGTQFDYGTGAYSDYTEAFKWFALASESDDACGQFFVGDIYEKGLGVETDINNSLQYYYLSAQQGYSPAITAIKRLADNGNVVAQYYVGNLYRYGYGVGIDNDKAFQYYSNSISNGSRLAYYAIAEMYENGLGVGRSYDKALEYYNILASENNAQAINALGRMYYYGLGVSVDYGRAIDLFRRAKAQNNSAAIVNLAIAYEQGKGVNQSEFEAIDLYLEALDLGNIQAAQNVSKYVETNMKGGYIAYNLGKYYESVGNLTYALESFSASTIRGYNDSKTVLEQYAYIENNDIAQMYLGLLYQSGFGFDKDYTKAKELYLMAIEQLNDSAYYHLGTLYEDGLGVEKDLQKAIEYYELAKQYGNLQADLQLKALDID